MARNIQLGTLVDRCKKRADMENQSLISDTEWKEYISEQYEELYAIIADAGYAKFDTEDTISTDGSTSYALPSDHLATVGVDYVVDNDGHRRTLVELMAQERNIFRGDSAQEAIAWRFTGENIELLPTPPSGQTYKHVYVPQPPDLSSAIDSTDVDMVTTSGLRFVIWGVTVMALSKEQSDTREAFAERERARSRVEEWAARYALNNPRRPVVRNHDILNDWWDPAEYHGGGW